MPPYFYEGVVVIQHRETKARVSKPRWLRRSLPTGADYEKVRTMLKEGRLHTVCQEARCPNLWECFSRHTATFLIMGSRCTRNCGFCAVAHGPSEPPDPGEPKRVAEAVQSMELNYVVVTSVTRDDLPDGGAGFFAETIKEIRKKVPDALVEVLIPDFQGNEYALRTVLDVRPNVLNHNIETVSRLYPSVRPDAVYRRSLELLKRVQKYDSAIIAKSGLMLGLGESSEEIRKALQDLLDANCSILALGQYLQPTKEHLPVERFIHPDEFDNLRESALEMGFSEVASGPFVRSSYHAKELYQAVSEGVACHSELVSESK
ncbi:MAG: lipoyl synthase [Syntrophales bacterium]|nr:lipoyl synthase [Syntrophales bacterium]